MIDENRLIEEIWINFNSYYNDASRFSEEETKMADRVWGGVQCMIESQPKVGEWIPCSERLPNPKGNEEFVRVEVTIQGKEKNVNMPAFYYYRIHKFFPWNIGGSPLKNVIAWMPLPEPYKAGDT